MNVETVKSVVMMKLATHNWIV